MKWLPFAKRIALSGHRLRGWDCAACSACRRWENAFLTCMNVSQTSPYFSSPVLTEKQKVKQPDVHTHTHTRRKLGNADNKFNLHSWTNRGLCHLCTITSLPLSQVPEPLPHPTLCNTDANEHSNSCPGDCQEKCWLPYRLGWPHFRFISMVAGLTKAHSEILHISN